MARALVLGQLAFVPGQLEGVPAFPGGPESIGDDGNPVVSVLNGVAQIIGPNGSGEISKGEVMTLTCQTAQIPALV